MHAGAEGAAPQSSLPTNKKCDEEIMSTCDVRRHDDFSQEGGATVADSEGHVTGAVSRQQAMNALEMSEGRKVRKNKCKVARLNDQLVVGARVIYNRK